jgi:Concanavalin A-like lectin/glucanases superfamily
MVIIPVTKQYSNGTLQTSGAFDEVSLNPSTWGSLFFDGSTGYLEYYNLSNQGVFCLSPSTAPNVTFTLELWIYYTGSYASTQTIISSWDEYNPSSSDYHVDINTSGYLSFTYNTSAGGPVTLTGTSQKVPINQWAHIAITRDSLNTVRMFVNGVADATTTTINGYFLGYTYPKIGANDNSSGTDAANQFFSGYITNLRAICGAALYTSNFTPPTAPFQLTLSTPFSYYPMFMNMSYNATAFIDTFNPAYPFTSHGLNGTVTSTPQNPFNPSGYYSNKFDGSTGYLSLAANSAYSFSNGNFTVESWVYPTSFGTYNIFWDQWKGSSGSFTTGQWQIGTSSSSGNVFFICATGSSSSTLLTSNTGLTLNTWNHVAVTRNSGTVTIYVNGNSTGATSFSSAVGLSSYAPNIGRQQNGNADYFSGYLSNLRVSNAAIYTTTFTPQTTALTASNSTVLLTTQYNRFIDVSTNGFTLTPSGNVSVSNNQPFTLSGLNVSKIISNGTFQTGGVIDEHTTITGAVSKSYSNGSLGISGSFDEVTNNPNAFGSLKLTGNNSYLSVAANSSLAFGSNPFTIEAWVYPTLATTGWSIYDQRASATTNNGIYFQLDNQSNVAFRTNNNTLYTGNLVATLNVWTHVALTKNSSNVINVWVNGQQSNATLTYNTALSDNSGIYIGRTTDNNAAYAANGYISNLRVINGNAIYTTAFTPPTSPPIQVSNTVLLLNTPNSPTGYTDFSNNNFTVTKTANVTLSNNTPLLPPGYYSYYFNGNSVIETSPTNNSNLVFGTGNYTIDFWFNPISNGTVQQVVWYNSTTAAASPAGGDLKITWGGPSGANSYLQLLGGSSGTSQLVYWAPLGTFSGTNWYHIAIVRNGNITALYVNGILTNQISNDYSNYNKGYFSLGGARTGTSAYFTGYISNFRIVNGIALYTAVSGFIPPTTPTLPVSNTVILTAQSNKLLDNGPGALGWSVTRQFTSSSNNPFANNILSNYSFVTNNLS